MRTGQVAEAAGVNVETLRYYERRGILKEPPRRSSGYREYPAGTVQVVILIKRAQEIGFSLEEVQDLLRLRNNTRRSCKTVRNAAAGKVDEIDQKICALRAMKRALSKLITACDDESATRECPILEALDDGSERKNR